MNWRALFRRANVDSASLLLVIGVVAWVAAATGALDSSTALRTGLAAGIGVLGWRMLQAVTTEPTADEAGDSGAVTLQSVTFEQAVLTVDAVDSYRPQPLERMEALVNAVTSGAMDKHVRMRPVLRDIAI